MQRQFLLAFTQVQSEMEIQSRFTILTLLALGVAGVPLSASVINDPAGDFLTTFTTGPKNGDLDVVSAQVFFDGTNFTFTSTENGPIGTTEGSVFVWGVDRGLHNQFFGVFRPGVLFDVAIVLRPDLTGLVVDFSPTDPAPPVELAPGSITISGNTIQGVVPASLLPSKGLQPADYQVNFWPRVGLDPANNAQISDFAPDNSDAGVTTAPEPSTMLFLGGGLIVIASLRRLAEPRL
jgi:PEP-CTERM motif